MEKKGSIGTKIFGVIFILLAGFLIQLPLSALTVYSPSDQNNVSRIIYRSYQMHINNLDYNQKEISASPLAQKVQFAKRFAQFKQEAEAFRQKYIVRKQLPLHAQVVISIGFAMCLVYVIVGFSLIMHFLWARNLALASMFLTLLFYLASMFDLYSMINFSNILMKKAIELQAILMPSAIGQLKFLLQDNFKFLLPIMLLMSLPLVLFAVCVIYYFTRPKVKEQFK